MRTVFGTKTIRTLADCSSLSQRIGVALSPAVLFFSALATIDPDGLVVAVDLRETALELTARYLRAEQSGNERGEQQIADLFADVGARTPGVVTPFDLLVSSAEIMPNTIEAGLAGIGSSTLSIVQLIRERLSEDALRDEAASPPADTVFKFAVVIEGPGFRETAIGIRRWRSLSVRWRHSISSLAVSRSHMTVLEKAFS